MRRLIGLLTALSAALALLVTTAPARGADTIRVYLPLLEQPGAWPQSDTQRQFAEEVVRLVNLQRASASPSCGPLTLQINLTAAAQGHSEHMAVSDDFSHSNFSKLAADAGYLGFAAAENIAAGYTTPAAVMQGWMNSSGHRRNLLDCSYDQIGVGYFFEEVDRYQHYWTQIFGISQ
jgi:uncharacterized protein YkwD